MAKKKTNSNVEPRLDRILNALKKASSAAALTNQSIALANQEVSRLMNRLRTQVERGGTTGDVYIDYTILHDGLNQELADYLRGLDEQLLAHKGELILIVERKEEKDKFLSTPVGCFGGGDVYNLHEYFCMGVIDGKSCIADKNSLWAITLTRSLKWTRIDQIPKSPQNATRYELEEYENRLAPHWATKKEISTEHTCYEPYVYTGINVPCLEIIVGNTAVANWWQAYATMNTSGMLNPKRQEKLDSIFKRIYDLIRRLDLLLLGVPWFERLLKADIKELEKELARIKGNCRVEIEAAIEAMTKTQKALVSLGAESSADQELTVLEETLQRL